MVFIGWGVIIFGALILIGSFNLDSDKTQPKSTLGQKIGTFTVGLVVAFFGWVLLPKPQAVVQQPTVPQIQNPVIKQPIAPKPVNQAPKPKPITASEKFGLLLAAIIKNPKVIAPYVVERANNLESFFYEAANSNNLQMLRMQNKKAAWQITFEPNGVTPEKLSGVGNLQEIKEMELGTVYKFTNGALKGAFLYPQTFADGSKVTALQSRDWVINKKIGAIAVAMVEKNMMPNVEFVTNSQMIETCEELVKEQLKAPSTAQFAEFLEKLDTKIYTSGNGDRLYKSFVDSQNSFGAMLRMRFECKYTNADGLVRVNLFEQ